MPSKDVVVGSADTDQSGASTAQPVGGRGLLHHHQHQHQHHHLQQRVRDDSSSGSIATFSRVSRACAVSLTLWVAVVCVLLGAATGYRPLKEKVLSFENSQWLNEVCKFFLIGVSISLTYTDWISSGSRASKLLIAFWVELSLALKICRESSFSPIGVAIVLTYTNWISYVSRASKPLIPFWVKLSLDLRICNP